MTKKLVTPSLQRASDTLLLRAGQRADDEAFHIIAVSDFIVPRLQKLWPNVSEHWQEQGFGHPIMERDAYGERTLWSLSDKGLAEVARLKRVQRQRSWALWIRRNALAIVGVLAAVATAVATSISAYIASLEVK